MCPGNGHSELLTSLCTVQKQKKYITDTTIQGGGDLGLGSREERYDENLGHGIWD